LDKYFWRGVPLNGRKAFIKSKENIERRLVGLIRRLSENEIHLVQQFDEKEIK
jgi:hypothetical protein